MGAGSPSTILSLNSNGSFVTYGGVTSKTPTFATSSAGASSPFLSLGASAFSSTSSSAVPQIFAWQVVPTGNNTTSPSSNIALLYGSGSAAPAPTGLSVSSTGLINWAPGQTFPITGTGGGTITGITTSSPLTGSGTSGSVALGLDTSALEATLNGVYPQLATANTFAQNQTMNSGLTVGGTANANLVNSTTGYQLGGVAFDSGNSGSQNVSLGYSSSPLETGQFNLGVGPLTLSAVTSGSGNIAAGGGALNANVSGSNNTALGDSALNANQDGNDNVAVGSLFSLNHPSGNENTAIGNQALKFWPAGDDNTALGTLAGYTINGQPGGTNNTFIGYWTKSEGNSALTDAAAIGANAVVGESNALILGGTGGDAGDCWNWHMRDSV